MSWYPLQHSHTVPWEVIFSFCRFFQEREFLYYPTGIKIGSKWPQHVLKNAEVQSEI